MNKQREALQRALEALTDFDYDKRQAAIAEVRDALAESEQEPLTDYQIREIDELVWKKLSCEEKTLGQFALKLTRAIERAHGIGGTGQ